MPLWRPKLRRRLGTTVHTGQLTMRGDAAMLLAGQVQPSSALGRPFGPFAMYASSTSLEANTDVFTSTLTFTSPADIINRINLARTLGLQIVITLTGGAHSQYLTNGLFDINKWRVIADGFSTTAIKAAIAAGVADGTIVGNSLIDEPHHDSWGGNVTKALVDQMHDYVRVRHPTLPNGCVSALYRWRETEFFQRLDFLILSFSWTALGTGSPGNVTLWRDNVLNMAQQNGVAIAFNMNVLDGGTRVDCNGVPCCPVPQTGGEGLGFPPNCLMTAAQIQTYGNTLGAAGAGLLMWRYDATYFARADVKAACAAVAAGQANRPKLSWRRPP